MPDLDTLRALKARVDGASGPSYKLECDITDAFDLITISNCTASIDAALALVERCGFKPVQLHWGEDGKHLLEVTKPNLKPIPFVRGEWLPTLPLAILSAPLAALIAEAEIATLVDDKETAE